MVSERVPGVIGPGSYSGTDIARAAKYTFGKNSVTPEELALVMDYLVPSQYILRNHYLKNGQQKFSFSVPDYATDNPELKLFHRPWQRQIVNDVYKDVVVKKSRQMGLSELNVAFMIWWADVHSQFGVNCLYAFPTIKQMRDFVKMRLDPVLQQTPYYRSITGESTDKVKRVNSVDVKKIRKSFLTFRTSSTSKGIEGVNADAVFLDEYDHVPAASEQSAINSMSSSPFQLYRRFSTPTTDNMGIDKLYDKSDQFEYLHRCPHCGRDNLMSFEDYDPNSKEAGGNIMLVNPDGIDLAASNIAPGTYQYVCKYCGKPLDRFYTGHWVSRYPSRTADSTGIRGYNINKMNAVWIDASDLKRSELRADSKQKFYNYDLGIAYTDSKMKVSKDDIVSNGRFPEQKKNREDYSIISVGIDWGVKHNIVISGMRENGEIDDLATYEIEGVDSKNVVTSGADIIKLRTLLLPYSPDIIIADTGYANENIARLIEIYGKDKVFGCNYSSNPRAGVVAATNQVLPTWNTKSNIVTVDKLTQHKRYIDMLKRHKIGIWKKMDNDLIQYIEDWENVVIREDEQDDGSTKQVITRKARDHKASASVYALLGIDYVKEVLYGDGSDTFDYEMLDTDLSPEKTDFSKMAGNGIVNLYD